MHIPMGFVLVWAHSRYLQTASIMTIRIMNTKYYVYIFYYEYFDAMMMMMMMMMMMIVITINTIFNIIII